MAEVLPAILEKTFEEVAEKCARLRGIVLRAQLDIADGAFVPEESWRDASQLPELGSDIAFDAHLMVERPEQWASGWAATNVFRITFHHNATYDALRTVKIIKEAGKEVGVALDIETPLEAVYDILNEIDLVLIMGVEPGCQGREFNPKTIERVRELRERDATIAIGVDGGVRPMFAPALIAAGATVLVSGSYVWESEDIAAAIASLRSEPSEL